MSSQARPYPQANGIISSCDPLVSYLPLPCHTLTFVVGFGDRMYLARDCSLSFSLFCSFLELMALSPISHGRWASVELHCHRFTAAGAMGFPSTGNLNTFFPARILNCNCHSSHSLVSSPVLCSFHRLSNW